jgi:hypothetical protein
LYREAGSSLLTGLRDAADQADERSRRVFGSAVHLAENLERVPALVIVTIYGTHDGSGRPGLFDSVIQSARNFCLAARARGIGTSWTTLHLRRALEVAELLGIPDGVTQIVLLPVAYTTGGDFRPAPRRPAGEIAFSDQWGFTTSTVPEPQRTHPGEGRGVSLDVDVQAPAERSWPLVSDITLPSRFSSEAAGATWDENAQPGPGARFHGSNACEDAGHPAINHLMDGRLAWTTSCQVERWDPRTSSVTASATPKSRRPAGRFACNSCSAAAPGSPTRCWSGPGRPARRLSPNGIPVSSSRSMRGGSAASGRTSPPPLPASRRSPGAEGSRIRTNGTSIRWIRTDAPLVHAG